MFNYEEIENVKKVKQEKVENKKIFHEERSLQNINLTPKIDRKKGWILENIRTSLGEQ